MAAALVHMQPCSVHDSLAPRHSMLARAHSRTFGTTATTPHRREPSKSQRKSSLVAIATIKTSQHKNANDVQGAALHAVAIFAASRTTTSGDIATSAEPGNVPVVDHSSASTRSSPVRTPASHRWFQRPALRPRRATESFATAIATQAPRRRHLFSGDLDALQLGRQRACGTTAPLTQ